MLISCHYFIAASNIPKNALTLLQHITGKNLHDRYCSKSEIPNIGIILIYRIVTYYNNFNAAIFICNIYYVLSTDWDLIIST
jgi:hypothetical protein